MSADLLVVIAPDVPVVRLAEALATAGLAVRHDSGRLVIRPASAGRMRTAAPELARLLNRLSLAGRGAHPD
jgi:hypothetical protein